MYIVELYTSKYFMVSNKKNGYVYIVFTVQQLILSDMT